MLDICLKFDPQNQGSISVTPAGLHVVFQLAAAFMPGSAGSGGTTSRSKDSVGLC